MLDNILLENVLILDIETVPGIEDYEQMDDAFKQLWEQKVGRWRKEEELPATHYFDNAAIYAEFGKVVCISVGFFVANSNGEWGLRIKSFFGDDERKVLTDFADLLNQHFGTTNKHYICGHNIKEFDVPYICRRMLINGLGLPRIIDIAGAKPWEVRHIDTMQLWRFGDYKHYTSLNLLACVFGIPTPKDDIQGKDVGRVFWKDKNLLRIATYCQKDVVTTARLLMRFKGIPAVPDEGVTIVG